ncbi:MAG: 50S ribosomal protein L22 [Candidatus Marinimicrobia bacterium]|nr:50S ribosomal protein L22 [Candidatus Neomarinimicrobiota bacterium]
MEGRSVNKYVKQSAKKIKPLLDEIRGKKVDQVLNTLHFMPQKSAKITENVIHSAVSNILNKDDDGNINPDELVVKLAYVTKGPTGRNTKRIRPRAMGRAYFIRKHSCHLTIEVGLPNNENNNIGTKE